MYNVVRVNLVRAQSLIESNEKLNLLIAHSKMESRCATMVICWILSLQASIYERGGPELAVAELVGNSGADFCSIGFK